MARLFKLIDENNAKVPKRATEHSAGYDISASETVTIQPSEVMLVQTGVAVSMNEGEVFKLYDRSSNFKRLGITLINSVGIIDQDFYPLPFCAQFRNDTNKPVTIRKGDRIMQGMFEKFLVTDDDNAVGERTGGFGSTGA